MKSVTAMRTWLAQMSREELTGLLERRGLPRPGMYRVDSLPGLAEYLLGDEATVLAVAELVTPELQVLGAVAQLAEQVHGPVAADRWAVVEPSTRAVPRARLLDFLAGAPGVRRDAAEKALDRLVRLALVLPPHGKGVSVPSLLHRQARELAGFGRPAGVLFTAAYPAATVQKIAKALDLPRARLRDEVQRQILAVLASPERVRALAAAAPPRAEALLEALVEGPPLLRTRCFVPVYGYWEGPGTKFSFRPEGSGDEGTDWLAARGLLVPVGPDLAELPYEVARALREDDQRPAFTPTPPAVTARPVPVPVAGQAQAAAAGAASRVELLLRAIAADPPALRKAGGLAVRDTRRLAKAIGAPEEETRLWLDLCAGADLIAPHHDQLPTPTGNNRRGRRTHTPPPPATPARMLPTTRYTAWENATPAGRLLPLIAVWAAIPEVFTWWPDTDQSPVAGIHPQDPHATDLRHALLKALAALPGGHGIGPTAPTGLPAPVLDQLLQAATWYRPAVLGTGDETTAKATATLREAEILGIVAHGALTPLGHGALALLDAGCATCYPAIPGTGIDLAGEGALARVVEALTSALERLLPEPQHTARFQADLTAVVTGAPAPDLTALLSGTADRESEGHAVVWRFTQASVRRALDTGADATALLARLAAVTDTPLPQPLDYLIRDTARTHGRIRVVDAVCCIRSEDEHLILEVSKTRTLARLQLRRIAPTVLVSTAPAADTLAALRAAGYAPVHESATGTAVIQRAPTTRIPAQMPTLAAVRRARAGHRHPATAAALAAALLSR
ncbi:helicase-associated domain-containing protein [Streptomyces sp. NPDC057909]|uniref:helicase-associated domain-containing protein n=1 Tax=Streptomyces sp. NPDC057909 TaxID=3346277 RepID=UPI0036EC37F2